MSKELEKSILKKPNYYVASTKHNPKLKTTKTKIKLNTLIIQEEQREIETRRFMVFFKKKIVKVSKIIKAIKVKDLKVGDVICLLDVEYPDRAVNKDFMLVSLCNGKQEEVLL